MVSGATGRRPRSRAARSARFGRHDNWRSSGRSASGRTRTVRASRGPISAPLALSRIAWLARQGSRSARLQESIASTVGARDRRPARARRNAGRPQAAPGSAPFARLAPVVGLFAELTLGLSQQRRDVEPGGQKPRKRSSDATLSMSASMLAATPGYCTLIASSRPDFSVARCTCPIEAAATGRRSNRGSAGANPGPMPGPAPLRVAWAA